MQHNARVPQETPTVSGQRAHVLVTDDDPGVRAYLAQTLQHEGYRVSQAADGAAALNLMQHHSIDLMLLDLVMPGMSGKTVCRRIKENPQTAHIPIIVITSLPTVAERFELLRAGANDYLTKPVDPQDLLLRVGNTVRMKALFDEVSRQRNELLEIKQFRDEIACLLVSDMGPLLKRIRGTLSAQPSAGNPRDSELAASIRCVDAIQNLSRSLLDISLMEFGVRETKMAVCDLGALAERVLQHCRLLTDGRAAHLFAEPSVMALCDTALTERILMSLVWNALRFASADHPVDIRVVRTPEGPALTVGDSGPAPTEALCQRLAGAAAPPVDDARDRRTSGLPIRFCRLAAKEQNGHLAVASIQGGGCEFKLTLQDKE